MAKRTTPTNQLFACGILCALAASGNAAPRFVAPDYDATRGITAMIESGQCKSAVEALKPGLKAKQPDVLLLAGTMYEEGLCVQRHWDKAAGLYMLADEAGNRSAALRLVAGYAIEGRDNGLALWWVAKRWGRGALPANCLPAADPDSNPDGFNDGLERMPPPLFQGCVYVAGVLGELTAQMRFPPTALYNGVSGSVIMEFRPAQGTIDWRQGELDVNVNAAPLVRDLARAQFEDRRAVENSLLAYMKGKGQFALSRYRRPESGIDPDFVFKTTFSFEIARR